jgi:agmatinase
MKPKFTALSLQQNFLAIEKEFSSFENSKIVILSCPYEKTTSYGKGTAKGPSAILKASHYVEFFDEETGKALPRREIPCSSTPRLLHLQCLAGSDP